MLYQLKRETIHQFSYTLEFDDISKFSNRNHSVILQHMLIAHVPINAWIGFAQFMGFTKHPVFDHVDIRYYIDLKGFYDCMNANCNYLVNLSSFTTHRIIQCNANSITNLMIIYVT